MVEMEDVDGKLLLSLENVRCQCLKGSKKLMNNRTTVSDVFIADETTTLRVRKKVRHAFLASLEPPELTMMSFSQVIRLRREIKRR